MWIARRSQGRGGREWGFRSLCLLVVISMVGGLVLAACGPKGKEEDEARAEQVTEVEEAHLAHGLGEQAVDLLALEQMSSVIKGHYLGAVTHPSPYLLYGGFSLDPKWYSNRVRIADLPYKPVDLPAALGVTSPAEDVPDLKVIYYPGDELVLDDGPKVRFRINVALEVAECLNNPSLNLGAEEECDPHLRDGDGNVLAIERDQGFATFATGNSPLKYAAGRFSGTVIYAKRIFLAGTVATWGYDLVLVADEIEFGSTGRIVTLPPERPIDGGGSGGAHTYGRGGPGYRAGDVVLLGRQISGPVNITTDGGRGQTGADNQDIQCQEVCRACPIQSSGQIPSEPSNCVPCSEGLTEPPGWTFDVGYYCTGTEGIGGQGGDAGNVTVIGADLPFEVEEMRTVRGGRGPNGAYRNVNPYGPESVAGAGANGTLDWFSVFNIEMGQGHLWVMDCLLHPEALLSSLPNCEYHDQKPANLLYECEGCGGGFYCKFISETEPYLQYKEQIWDWCEHYGHSESGIEFFYCDPGWPTFWPECPEPAGVVHRHCRMNEDMAKMYDCKRWPEEFPLVNANRGDPGQAGAFAWYPVDVQVLLQPLEQGVASEGSSFEAARVRMPSEAAGRGAELSNLDYVRAVHALAPRSAELMLLKADYVYRSLTDSDLRNGDAAYVANAAANPNGENRILKAQYLYDSVLYLAADALVADPPRGDRPLEGITGSDWFRALSKPAIVSGHQFMEALSEDNPFRAEVQMAYARKRQLSQGRNFFGLSLGLYLYAKPSEVWPYHQALSELNGDAAAGVQTAKDRVAALKVAQTAAALERDWGIGHEVDLYEAELVLAEARLRTLAARLDMTLEAIGDNAQAIDDTVGEEVEVTACLPCLLNPDTGDCLAPTIQSEVALLEQCARQKPCDFGCWMDRVITFAKAVVATVKLIYGLVQTDWASVFKDLSSAMEAAQSMSESADTFVQAVKAIGEYADFLSGETGQALLKQIEVAVEVGQQVGAIVAGADDLQLTSQNRIAEEVASIAVHADAAAQGLQQNLTEIYNVQAEIDRNRDHLLSFEWAMGHARSMEDLIKRNQERNWAIPGLQREHVLAAQEYSLALTEWEVLRAKIDLAKEIEADLDAIVGAYDEALLQAQADLDVAVRHANLIQDRALLMAYFYQRSRDYLYLDPPSDVDWTANLLLSGDEGEAQDSDGASVVLAFLEATPHMETGHVRDIIAPAGYVVLPGADPVHSPPVSTARSEEERIEALCPDTGARPARGDQDGCSLTSVAYDDRIVQQLMSTGVASFEIYPESLPSFRALDEEDKREWNRGFSSADLEVTASGDANTPALKKRVIDVGARIVTEESYRLPDPSIGAKIRVSHGPEAEFLMSAGERVGFYFPPTAMQDACRAAVSLIDEDRVSCEDYQFFYREVEWPPSGLGSLGVEEFETYTLFGTSLRGTWTLDITAILNQMTPQEQEAFWPAFRGIQYEVSWVSIE